MDLQNMDLQGGSLQISTEENVKSAVQNMTNVTVSRVDLVIAGLAEAQ